MYYTSWFPNIDEKWGDDIWFQLQILDKYTVRAHLFHLLCFVYWIIGLLFIAFSKLKLNYFWVKTTPFFVMFLWMCECISARLSAPPLFLDLCAFSPTLSILILSLILLGPGLWFFETFMPCVSFRFAFMFFIGLSVLVYASQSSASFVLFAFRYFPVPILAIFSCFLHHISLYCTAFWIISWSFQYGCFELILFAFQLLWCLESFLLL